MSKFEDNLGQDTNDVIYRSLKDKKFHKNIHSLPIGKYQVFRGYLYSMLPDKIAYEDTGKIIDVKIEPAMIKEGEL